VALSAVVSLAVRRCRLVFHDAVVGGIDGAAEGNGQSAADGVEDKAAVALGALKVRKQRNLCELDAITYLMQEPSGRTSGRLVAYKPWAVGGPAESLDGASSVHRASD
jgi:hypothetical protein